MRGNGDHRPFCVLSIVRWRTSETSHRTSSPSLFLVLSTCAPPPPAALRPPVLSFSLHLTVLTSPRFYILQICLSIFAFTWKSVGCEMCTMRENVFKLRANISHSYRNVKVAAATQPEEHGFLLRLFLGKCVHVFIALLRFYSCHVRIFPKISEIFKCLSLTKFFAKNLIHFTHTHTHTS